MANLLQMTNKSEMLEKKADQIVGDVIADIKRNDIPNRAEYIHRIYIALRDFYDSIGKPTMKNRPAEVFPISKDYNDMMSEIRKDFAILNDDISELIKTLDDAYKQIELDRTMISNLIESTDKKYEKTSINSISNQNVFLESFITLGYFDTELCEETPCNINTLYKRMSLANEKLINLNQNAVVEIQEKSNGFPGNTHQVNLISNKIKFLGESGLRINLTDILDGNDETWFEYELYNIPENERLDKINLGFNYSEGISWISDVSSLNLDLRIFFANAELMNNIALKPFIASDKDYAAAKIVSLKISDSSGKLIDIVSSEEIFNTDKAYYFEPIKCKNIFISLRQPNTYKTDIGHFYYKSIGMNNVDYFKSQKEDMIFRVNGPVPSIQNLGIVYDTKQKKLIQPSSLNKEAGKNDNLVKNNLFNLVPDTNGSINALEHFEANRFLIGIRDISCFNFSYKEKSEYVSTKFTSTKPISNISMIVDDFIPKLFPQSDKDYIRYYFSINDGLEWHPIIPRGLNKLEGYSKYIINSGTPANYRDKSTGYIETPQNEYSIRIKIILERPTDIEGSEFYSPMVNSYKVFV